MSKDFLDERVVPPLSSGPGDWRLSDSIKRSALLRTKLPAPCVTLASIIRSWTLSRSQWYTRLLRAFKTENSFLFIRRLKDDFARGGNERRAFKKVRQGPIQMRAGEFTKHELYTLLALFICTSLLVVLMHESINKPQTQPKKNYSIAIQALVFIKIRYVCNKNKDNLLI